MRLSLLLAAALGCLSITACAPADDADDDEGLDQSESDISSDPSVVMSPGEVDTAELVKTIEVGQKESSAKRAVVMRLRPEDIPNLKKGDRLIVPAEVQATTRCDVGQTGPGCNYNPTIRAQIIMTGDPGDTTGKGKGSVALSDAKTQSCTHADHHCMFVFTPDDTNKVLEGGADIPCVAANTCSINLVMWAWDSHARSGGQDKVLIGGNDGNYLDNGKVEQDIGRLSVVRERGVGPSDRHETKSGAKSSKSINIQAQAELVYSHPLKPGKAKILAGEQFIVEALVPFEVSDRARISTEMFVTKNGQSVDAGKFEKITPSQIAEHNGFNCTAGTSPCMVRRVAVFRADQDIDGPLFVNVTAISAVPGGGYAHVEAKRANGWVKTTRYAAALDD